MIRALSEFVAVLSCALFAGASIYVNLVEHPARMECGIELAATEFGPSYRRATIMQASLAAAGFLFSVVAWIAGAGFGWAVLGIVLGGIIPFTLFAILPTNRKLLSPELDRRSPQTGQLLAHWSALHAVRSVLSSAALLGFLYLLIFTDLH